MDEKSADGLDVTVMPNPVSSLFDIAIRSKDMNTPVSIRIMASDGRIVLLQKSTANSVSKMAADKWRPGVYFVEVIQGNERKIVRIVKI